MSGDVQPRKRKDKKKKRESLDYRKSEGELTFSRKSSLQDDEASHGVHITKMMSDDVHLHVQHDHGTGGHWCAKIIFFSLMTILLGLVCLIILENRGLSDVDTPLSESRFSNYFEGWVDEHRADDHDHGDVHGSLEDDHDDEHDDHDDDNDEPYEEEADISEGDADENVTQEEAEEADEDDENITAEEDVTAEDAEEDEENITAEEDNATAEDENVTPEDDNVTAEDDNATAEDENVTAEDENVTAEEENLTAEEENLTAEEEEDNTTNEENLTHETSQPISKGNHDDDDTFEEDDDVNMDSMENIVDNDAAELELLKEKARQQAAAESKNDIPASEENEEMEEQASSWASSLTLKIGVGLALALVARLVLLKKNPNTNQDDVAAAAELLMKRRLTIATPEEDIPEDSNDMEEILPDNDEYSEEEIEIEEEIEYIDEIEEEPAAEENEVDAGENVYKPETFEELNAMYRPKGYKAEDYNVDSRTQTKTEPETYSYRSPYETSFNTPTTTTPSVTTTTNNTNTSQYVREESSLKSLAQSNNLSQRPLARPPIFEAPPPPPLVEATIDVGAKPSTYMSDTSQQSPSSHSSNEKNSPSRIDDKKYSPPNEEKYLSFTQSKEKSEKDEEPKPAKREVTYDMDYQPEIDYDEDDIYDDDEEGQDDDSEELDDDDDLIDDDDEDDEEEDEEMSDIDDTELMNRLEAKYGKLPAKEYESDEDPEDPTWTRNY
ncbi:aspartyl beta-hydroxylase isoform X1 [Haematobia irritans]|uniref:aspartyl beta-hydroxylase isoform X1 n=1 Tax=Haematobia irritans TaxID=7368 RepID=UPI003F50772D